MLIVGLSSREDEAEVAIHFCLNLDLQDYWIGDFYVVK